MENITRNIIVHLTCTVISIIGAFIILIYGNEFINLGLIILFIALVITTINFLYTLIRKY